MIIRDATFFDVPEILKLADVYIREEVEPLGYHSASWNAEMMAHNLMQSINSEGDFVQVITCDGSVIGYLWAATHCLGPWTPTLVASDYLFYITPESRGSIAAYKLIKSYKAWALGLGCVEVRLSVASGINQERTSKLYSRLGFDLFASVHNHKV